MEINKDWLVYYIWNSDAIEGIFYIPSGIKTSITKKNGYPYLHSEAFNKLMKEPTEQNLISAFNILMSLKGFSFPKHIPYRTCEVTIGGRQGLGKELLMGAMGSLFAREVKTVEDICRFHIDYEHIHPFADGNGRTGRLLLNSQLNSIGYSLVIIPVDRKHEYYGFIQQQDVPGFVTYVEELSSLTLEDIIHGKHKEGEIKCV